MSDGLRSSWLALLVPLLLWAALFARPATKSILREPDEDIWWHLRVGQWVVEHRDVTATDEFSQYGLSSGKPWLAYSWLFEVVVYGAYQALGYQGVILIRAALTLAVLLALTWFITKREPRLVPAGLLAAIAFLAFFPLISERPWLLTVLGSIWTLDVVLEAREGMRSWRFWLLPLAYVLWANIHIQFVYGLFMLGLACACPVLDRLVRRHESWQHAARFATRDWWLLVGLTAVCTAATLVNPYHVKVYQVVLEYGTHVVPARYVEELKPMEFRLVSDWAVLALGGAAVFALGRRERISSFDALLLIAAGWFAFRMRRDGWFLMLSSISILATSRPFAGLLEQFRGSLRQAAIVTAAFVPLLVILGWWQRSDERVQAEIAAKFPMKAVEFVKKQGYTGPLYNDFNWGGYLIWNLPELPVSMDGRTNLHGDPRIERAMFTWRGMEGWETDPELRASRLVIARRGLPLVSHLQRDPQFKQVYADEVALVFVATSSKEPLTTSQP